MNKVIRLGMVFNEGDVPDFGSVVGDINQEGLYYLLAEDIPKLNTMLTRAAAENYLTGNEAFPFFSGYMAYVTDYKDAGTGEIYAYHRGSDHWYEFNIRLDKSFGEIMWERHKRILRDTKTISGTAPQTFKSNGRPLKNYRIYGNTVNGESVGNLVTEGEYTGEYCVPVRTEGKNMINSSDMLRGYWAYADGAFSSCDTWICTPKLPCEGGKYYTFHFSSLSRWYGFVWYDSNNRFICTNNEQNNLQTEFRSFTAKAPDNAAYMAINIAGYPDANSTISPESVVDLQLERGSFVTAFEPYFPPSITNIYLSHQIQKNGDNYEYIDYRKKMHYHIGDPSESISLPALPTFSGTNILSILTEIQPSNISVGGRINT